jgi:uncharacterized protein (DUF849 family)
MLPGDDEVQVKIGDNLMLITIDLPTSRMVGGNLRVGLEDNIYLDKGVLASNGMLVECSVGIIERLGEQVLGADEARSVIGLK